MNKRIVKELVKLAKELTDNIDNQESLDKAVNLLLSKLNANTNVLNFHVKEAEITEDPKMIEVTIGTKVIIKDPYFEAGLNSYSNKYYSDIKKLVREIFNTDVDFNNTGSTFWFVK